MPILIVGPRVDKLSGCRFELIPGVSLISRSLTAGAGLNGSHMV